MKKIFTKNKRDIAAAGRLFNIGYLHVFFALLCGILLFLSFPKFGLGFFAWIAFVPLFLSLRDIASWRTAFFLGWLAGLSAYAGIIYWIVFVVVNYGGLPTFMGVLLMLLLATYLGFYVAVFSGGLVYLKHKAPLALTAPVLWICLEYLKSSLFSGFPWENLGYSQFQYLYLIQMADIAGVYGISFLIMLVNVAFFSLLTEKTKKTYALCGFTLIMVVCIYAYGVWRIQQVSEAYQKGQSMEVSLIQGNIDQSVKWDKSHQNKIINTYQDLTLKNPAKNKGLVIWPETAVPFIFQDTDDMQHRVRSLPERLEDWFVFGSVSYERRGKETNYFNSAYLLSPQGNIAGKYDKVHLVPYGEYVPMKTIFPFISRLAQGIGDFAEGKGFYPLNMGGNKIGVLICYEGILPEAGRAYKNAGADLLVNITNDAWFGATSAPYQHLSMSVFRAVETRLYLARAANTGISAIVDPTGRLLAQTLLFQEARISGRVQFALVPTIYARYGDALVYICFIGLFIGIATIIIKNLQRRKKCP